MRRVILIVLDGVGVGELPDAPLYGDEGSNTLGNLARSLGGLELPFFESLGLGNIIPIEGVPPAISPVASYGRMAEVSPGKDSISGHWELAGVQLDTPFPTYPDGFPEEVILPFVREIGRPVLGNVAASGTEIIEELGARHLETGYPIVYTSADSVFQIAAHESVYSREELYSTCAVARRLLSGKHAVARVIARPFAGGEDGGFHRTPYRRDFSLPPLGKTILDALMEHGITTVSVGKVKDLFSGRGIAEAIVSRSNDEGMEIMITRLADDTRRQLLVSTLVEFDMLWGHRNDCPGFRNALRECDSKMPRLVDTLSDEDLLIITADHGNDPTTPSTDHSREYIPLLLLRPGTGPGRNLGTRATFSDVAATIAAAFGISWDGPGESLFPASSPVPAP